jgi:hypothetical protein
MRLARSKKKQKLKKRKKKQNKLLSCQQRSGTKE